MQELTSAIIFLFHHHLLDDKLSVILISNESDKVTLQSIS